MFIRSELKARARSVLRTYYFKLFALTIILAVITGKFADIGVGINGETEEVYAYLSILTRTWTTYDVTPAMVQTIATISVVCILLKIFVFNPLQFGIEMAFVAAEREEFDAHRVFMGFEKQHYSNLVKLYFFREIKITLYFLLLIVPGIIKCYEYCMMEYIYYDHPDMNTTELFKESTRLTMGAKWDIFVLYLSFFGWYLLAGLCDIYTLGVASLALMPYIHQTSAELYLELDSIHNATPVNFEPAQPEDTEFTDESDNNDTFNY